MKHLFVVAASTLLLGICTACAQDSQVERVQRAVAQYIPEIKQADIRPTSAPGLYEVQSGALFGYVTADGKFMVQGDLINIESGEELTENRRREFRLDRLKDLGADNTIEFAPSGKPKHVVTVFTDIDCGYCRKLHAEISEYNAAGIAIRYVFYPRAGLGSDSYRKAEAVWCASDRKAAMTHAKAGAPVVGPTSCDNPIAREWQLGQELGLRGTPMLILPDGEVVNGYVPAQALAARLDQPPQHDRIN
ncbi:MAG TPA: DsbC family protein [Solimonas sp.]|nr:DsbC family protein [Solimonas sp.]